MLPKKEEDPKNEDDLNMKISPQMKMTDNKTEQVWPTAVPVLFQKTIWAEIKYPFFLTNVGSTKFELQNILGLEKKLKSDLSLSDFPIPDLTCPNLSRPDVTGPDLTLPDLSEPDLTGHDLS